MHLQIEAYSSKWKHLWSRDAALLWCEEQLRRWWWCCCCFCFGADLWWCRPFWLQKKLSYINLRVACLEVSCCCCCCSAVIVIDRHHPTARLMPIRFVDHPLQFSFHLPSFTDNSQKCRLWETFLAFLAPSTDVRSERQRWNRCVARSFKFVLLMRFWCSGRALFFPDWTPEVSNNNSRQILKFFLKISLGPVLCLWSDCEWLLLWFFWFFFGLGGLGAWINERIIL